MSHYFDSKTESQNTGTFMNHEKLKELLKIALVAAKRKSSEKLLKAKKDTYDTRFENGFKSRKFVKSLRKQFDEYYQEHKNDRSAIIVESAGKTKEFLHDISVMRAVCVPSPMEKSQIYRIVEMLWQIEIEMSNLAQDFMKDLNKLGAGSRDCNKLYVVQRCWLCNGNNKSEWAREQVSEIYEGQGGRFFFAFIPHPKDWNSWENETVDELIEVCEIQTDLASQS